MILEKSQLWRSLTVARNAYDHKCEDREWIATSGLQREIRFSQAWQKWPSFKLDSGKKKKKFTFKELYKSICVPALHEWGREPSHS